MQKSIVLTLLILPFCVLSQNNFQVIASKAILKSSVVSDEKVGDNNNYTFQLNSLRQHSLNSFSIYSKTTNLNDFYGIKKDTFYYQKSILIPKNTFYSSSIDSFNPNGASNFGSAIISGVLSSIFSEF